MPVKIFFCYAHEDELLLNNLKSQLRPLQQTGLIDFWYDRDISAGTDWEQQIKEQLNNAQIILLLVSPDFMNSDYINDIEMQRALERDKRGEARVIPVILRPIYWQGLLGKYQVLPKDGLPVTDPKWHSIDQALFNVEEGIRKIVEEVSPQHSSSSLAPVSSPQRVRICHRLWSVIKVIWLIIFIFLFFNSIVYVISLSQDSDIYKLYLMPEIDWLIQHLLPLILTTTVLITVTIISLICSHKNASETIPLGNPPTQQDRNKLVERLYKIYAKQLDRELKGVEKMTLDLNERTDVTLSPAQFVFRRTNAIEEYPLPPGTSITQAYDNAGQSLLILGEPGAGKTTQLLDLVCELLTRAQSDLGHPIPVILNLTSWATKQQRFDKWFIEYLQSVYNVQLHFIQTWLEQGQWILLLDGLNEVERSARSACIHAINIYLREYNAPLVVCSRSNEYLAQGARLALSSAVVIQPLKEERVKEYLKGQGKRLDAVHAALRSNSVLQQVITVPLMLFTVIQTYRDKSDKDLPQMGSAEEQIQQIFERYFQRMFEQPLTKEYYTRTQTSHWLTWLAQQMQQRHLTEFYLERMQPSWLSSKRALITYIMLVRLLFGLSIGLDVGLVIGLISGLGFGVTIGLAGGLIGGLSYGLGYGLGIKQGMEEIHTTRESLDWSWSGFWKGLGIALGIAFIIGLIAGWIYGPSIGLISAISALPFFILFLGMFFGIAGEQITKHRQVKPNQGIENSRKYAVRTGILGMLYFGFGYGLAVVQNFGFGSGLVWGPIGGLVFGLSVGLSSGGATYFEHYILRAILRLKGVIPWCYVRFLDEAYNRYLLQKVGGEGGYSFYHLLFQDYLSRRGEVMSPDSDNKVL